MQKITETGESEEDFSYLLLWTRTFWVTLVMKRVSAEIMQREWENKEGAREIKANREGNPRGLSFERALQSGLETQRKERKRPQRQNRGLDQGWLKTEPLIYPTSAAAAVCGPPVVPALPGWWGRSWAPPWPRTCSRRWPWTWRPPRSNVPTARPSAKVPPALTCPWCWERLWGGRGGLSPFKSLCAARSKFSGTIS